MPQTVKTFRVFVSSTFSDMRAERRILHEKVFPKLEKLCRKNGAKFQAVDLRWGVNEESQLNQKTMDICLNEIARCQRLSPKPNFIILLGNRYGWQPVPYSIPEYEMCEIFQYLSYDARNLIDTWYRLDNNAVPAEYVLQPRRGKYKEYFDWKPVEQKLLNILRSAVSKTAFNDDQKNKYFTSATHQEIITGALSIPSDLQFDPKEHVFAYIREVKNRPENNSKYIENWEDTDTNAQIQLPALKEALYTILGNHYQKYSAFWDGEDIIPENPIKFGNTVFEHLEMIIKDQLQATVSLDEVKLEVANHQNLKKSLIRHFIGRKNELKKIAAYIEDVSKTSILNIVGESGSGKTSVMAKAITDAEEAHKNIFYRFLGTSSRSSNIVKMLHLLCSEIAVKFDTSLESLITEEQRKELYSLHVLGDIFAKCLALANAQKPIIIFLDALDQIGNSGQDQNFSWLCGILPPHTKIIVSSLPYVAKKLSSTLYLELPGLPAVEAKELLSRWLTSSNRKITQDQEQQVLTGFSSTKLPLYLKLAFEQAKKWHSYTPQKHLPCDVAGILDEWLKDLRKEHSRNLLSIVLQYMLSGKYHGLTEDEILDLLVLDKEYWPQFLDSCHPDHRDEVEKINKIPMVVWSRLFLDLEPYLTEKDADGEIIICFYHRQFNELIKSHLQQEKIWKVYHKKIADYFNVRWHEPYFRALKELPFQYIKAGDVKGLCNVLTDLEFIESKCTARMIYDLVNDYIDALVIIDQSSSEYNQLIEFKLFVQSQSHILNHHPELTFQQAINFPEWSLPNKVAKHFLNSGRFIRPWLDWRNKPKQKSNCIKTLSGHSFIVATCAYSAAGDFIASGSGDLYNPTIKIWNANTGDEITTLVGHSRPIRSCAFSPYGPYLISASEDCTLRLWNIDSCIEISTLTGHSSAVIYCDYLPDGRRIISASRDGTIKIWDATTKNEIVTLRHHHEDCMYGVCCCFLSQNGRIFASVSHDREIKIWDTKSYIEIATWKCGGNLINKWDEKGDWSCSLSPDGNRIATALNDNNVHVLNVKNGDQLLTLPTFSNRVTCCTYSPDGNTIVTSSDKILTFWDAESGMQIGKYCGHSSKITFCSYTINGDRLVSSSWDRTLKIWDTKNIRYNKRKCIFNNHNNTVTACSYSSDGNFIATSSKDGYISIWDAKNGSKLKNLTHCNGPNQLPVNYCCYSPDNNYIISATNSTVKVWNNNDAFKSKSLPHFNTTSWIFSPDSNILITASSEIGGYVRDKSFNIWNLKDLDENVKLSEHSSSITSCAFSPDGYYLATASDDKTINLWELTNKKVIYSLSGHSAGIKSCSFSPDGKHIIAVDGVTLKVWNVETGLECYTIDAVGSSYCLYSPDGLHFLIISSKQNLLGGNSTVTVFDSLSGHLLYTIPAKHGMDSPPLFLSNTSYVVSRSYIDRSIKIWNILNGSIVATYIGESSITSFDVYSSNEMVAGDSTGRVIILKLNNMQFELPLVTAVCLFLYDNHTYDNKFSCQCYWCGTRFVPAAKIIDAIRSINSHLSSGQSPCIELPKEVWDEPILKSRCPNCLNPLKFNPFLVDNSRRFE